MCAPRADTPVHITLTREDWSEIAAAFDLLPHIPEQDPPGLTHLYETLAALGLISPV